MRTIAKLTGGMFAALVMSLLFFPTQGQAQYDQQRQAAPTEIGESEITAFVEAQQEVNEIQQSYGNQLSSVENAEERQSIVQEANNQMVAAIQEHGLTVELFNTILNRAQADPELKARIGQAMQDL